MESGDQNRGYGGRSCRLPQTEKSFPPFNPSNIHPQAPFPISLNARQKFPAVFCIHPLAKKYSACFVPGLPQQTPHCPTHNTPNLLYVYSNTMSSSDEIEARIAAAREKASATKIIAARKVAKNEEEEKKLIKCLSEEAEKQFQVSIDTHKFNREVADHKFSMVRFLCLLLILTQFLAEICVGSIYTVAQGTVQLSPPLTMLSLDQVDRPARSPSRENTCC